MKFMSPWMKDNMGVLRKVWKFWFKQRKHGFFDSADGDAHGIITVTSAINFFD